MLLLLSDYRIAVPPSAYILFALLLLTVANPVSLELRSATWVHP
jgi:hypothetical protein